jgi:signal transduction histidine kinase
MSSLLTVSNAFAGLSTSRHPMREDELQEDNDALVQAALTATRLRLVAEDALRRQTRALALAAHELRNPLMPIRTVAVLLGQAASLDQLPLLAATIERQVTHMTRMIDDLLDAARVTTGKLHLHRTRLDLREVFDNVSDVCKPAMDTRRQAFSLRIPDHPLMLEGDLVRLTQVFTNILNNASKYTPVGGMIALDCSVDGPGEDGACEVVVAVSDNGIGIAPEALPVIWEPFVQGPLAIDFSKEGLGVGLTLVRELVQAHAGTVSANSAGAGHGSQFVVVLPLAGTDWP